MCKKHFVCRLISALLSTASLVHPQQQPAKIPRRGYLIGASLSASSARIEALRQGLRELGYVEGKNIVIEWRYAEGKRDRLPALAAELVRLQVDVIFANSTTIALVAKNATRTIPIVFLSAAEPVASGLVDSLARPGGNLTGFATIAALLAGKRLELLKETIPKLSRVAVLWEPRNQGSEESWKESQLAARQLGLQIHSMEVSSPDKFESAFSVATKTRSDALAVTLSGLFSSHEKLIVSPAAKRRLRRSTLGKNLSRRWLNVLRGRPRRTLQARSVDGRQDSKRRQARQPSC